MSPSVRNSIAWILQAPLAAIRMHATKTPRGLGKGGPATALLLLVPHRRPKARAV